MDTFIVRLADAVTYTVDADTREDAIVLALEWWDEREPAINVMLTEKKENNNK